MTQEEIVNLAEKYYMYLDDDLYDPDPSHDEGTKDDQQERVTGHLADLIREVLKVSGAGSTTDGGCLIQDKADGEKGSDFVVVPGDPGRVSLWLDIDNLTVYIHNTADGAWLDIEVLPLPMPEPFTPSIASCSVAIR